MIKNKFRSMFAILMILIISFTAISCTSNGVTQTTAGEKEKKQDPIVLKLGHAQVVDHFIDVYAKKFASLVKERTDGLVDIQVFPASQLGNEKDMLEAMSLGSLDMGLIVGGPYGYLQPEFELLSLVYLFDDAKQAEKILRGEIGKELSDKLLKSKGVRILDPFWYYGARSVTTNKLVNNPDDLKGMKIRVPEVPIQKQGLIAMGAQATPVDFGELYMALQTGIVDGQENPLATINTSNLYQVQKNLVLTRHIITENMPAINEKKFQMLTPEQQKILYEAAYEVAQMNNETAFKVEEELLQELKNKGMNVIDIDIKPFKEKVKQLHAEYDKKYDGLITRINEAKSK